MRTTRATVSTACSFYASVLYAFDDMQARMQELMRENSLQKKRSLTVRVTRSHEEVTMPVLLCDACCIREQHIVHHTDNTQYFS